MTQQSHFQMYTLDDDTSSQMFIGALLGIAKTKNTIANNPSVCQWKKA